MEKITISKCECPVCHAPDAELRSNKNGRAYTVCDECVSLCRTSSRRGDAALRALAVKEANTRESGETGKGDDGKNKGAPVPDTKPSSPAAEKPKKRGAFADALGALTGGGNG